MSWFFSAFGSFLSFSCFSPAVESTKDSDLGWSEVPKYRCTLGSFWECSGAYKVVAWL